MVLDASDSTGMSRDSSEKARLVELLLGLSRDLELELRRVLAN